MSGDERFCEKCGYVPGPVRCEYDCEARHRLAEAEAALAAARQVDEAMAKRAWDAWFAACEEQGADLDGMRAALLAALNTPEPEGER